MPLNRWSKAVNDSTGAKVELAACKTLAKTDASTRVPADSAGYRISPKQLCFCHSQHCAVQGELLSKAISQLEAMPEDCSRAKSRVARALLRKRGILGAAMPATCPLHADLYGDQEQHKRALRRSLYKCAYCGKTFSSEDWLDRHFDRKHADTLAADGFCLGDLCDVLDCAAAPRPSRARGRATTTTTTARATTTATAGRGGGGATTTTATTTGRAAPR